MPLIKNITIIIFVTCALLGTEAFASAGHVIYSFGNNYVLNNKGKKHEIRKGDEVFSGDTLITSQHGRVQLRFSDKGMVSIMPDSEYKIDDYEFVPGDDNKQKGFFSLLRGGARQITGLLSKFRHERFRFRTTVATIGIRGTGFYVRLCKNNCYDGNGKLLPDGMYTKNDTGIITMSNDGGEIELAQGQSAFSANNKDKPKQIYEPPAPYNVAFNDVETFDFNIGNAIRPDITSTPDGQPGPTLPPTGPVALNLQHIETAKNTSSGFAVQSFNVINTVNGDSTSIHDFTGLDNIDAVNVVFDANTATLSDKGSNSSLGVTWSRWTGNAVYTIGGFDDLAIDNNYHVIGATQLTPVANFPSTPITYSTSNVGAGGTLPTFTGFGGNFVGTQKIDISLDYGANQVTGLSIALIFNGSNITGSLSPTAGVTFTTNSTKVPMSLTCPTTTLCGGNGGSMNGQITINQVGTNAQGVIGAFAFDTTSTGNTDFVSGSYLATQ
jgi:hypothetical protein